MNKVLPNLSMPTELVALFNKNIGSKPDGEYLINLNNTDYSEERGGVRPYEVCVKKENGNYKLLKLSNLSYFCGDLVIVTQFDFVLMCGFVEVAYSFKFSDDPYIDECITSNLLEMTGYDDIGFFDDISIVQLNIK